MSNILLLLVAALALRSGGAMVRPALHAAPLRLAGWVLCAVAAWLAAGAAGAWFPVWPVLAVGIAAGALDLAVGPSKRLMAASDAAVVVMSGALSIPALHFGTVISLAVLVGVVGYVLDWLSQSLPRRIQLATFCGHAFAVAVLAIVVVGWSARNARAGMWHRDAPLTLVHLAISRPLAPERVELSSFTGNRIATAWIERPRQHGRTPGALIFHGNHRAGSAQPASCVLRRALLHAGYVVMSVDHPGFGSTPVPPNMRDIDAWDPGPIALAALRRLRAEVTVRHVLVIGHSMGCLDALRILAHGGDGPSADVPNAVMLFGMAVYVQPEPDDRWVRNFLHARMLPQDALNVETGTAIRERYYNPRQLLARDESDWPPLLFVRFGMEHDDIVAGRDVALGLMDDKAEVWDMDSSTHYFSATSRLGVLLGDVRITRLLSERFRDLRYARFNVDELMLSVNEGSDV